MPFDAELASRVRAALQSRKVAYCEKRMMGGLCFLVDDKMCVGVEKDRLMVRLDPEYYETALRRPGCIPMDFTGRPMRGFVFVKPEGCGTPAQLGYWLKLGLEFNPKARSSKSRR